MKAIFNDNLIALANATPFPIYAVGGLVRDYLIEKSATGGDFDISAPATVEMLLPYLNRFSFKVVAEYKRTGTVVFTDGKVKYEFSSFREEEYVGGEHTPKSITFTTDVLKDALRRDFKCNAVYYDIKNDKFVDPLGGIEDIKQRVLSTVTLPEKVFKHDGLRLMRLARFSGELNFTPSEQTLKGATLYADNILQISPERIYDELKKILVADKKHPFSNPKGHYYALKVLEQTRVLDRILPQLTLGRGMEQRKDFHLYDVLEHSLKSVYYAPKEVRLACLLHDVAKPYCMKKTGKFYGHDYHGEIIAEKILTKLKVENSVKTKIKFLIKYHMLDLDCKMRESKVRLFIVKNYQYLKELFLVKQADFSACKDVCDTAPTISKWQNILDKMKNDGTPFTLKELNITANDLIELGFNGKQIGEKLQWLFEQAVLNPALNQKEKLINTAKKHNVI